jgi:protease-4
MENNNQQNYAYTGGNEQNPNPASAPAYAYGYAPGAKKRKRWPIAVIISIAATCLASFIVGIVAGFNSDAGASKNRFVSPGKAYVAKLSVVGEIGDFDDPYTSSDDSYHHDWTLKMIDDVKKDANNAGLIIVVDSPGGTVYESDELYNKIKAYMEDTKRPVYVYMRSMAASGGYYISAPATKIVANRNTWTGSIGVIVGTLFDVSGFLEKYGIKAEDITSGPNKSMGSYFEPMTKEQRAIYQSMVDEAYGQFVDIVAEGRSMSADEVKKIADGRIMTANQAQQAGLIDSITDEESFYVFVKDQLGDENMNIENMRYNASEDLISSFLPSLIKAARGEPDALEGQAAQGDISRVLDLAQTDGKAPIKYMYE